MDSKFISINVTNPGPGFSIAFETDSITVEQGQSDTVAINITRLNNNTEGIDFIASTPLGLSGTFSQQFNVTGNTAKFIIKADQTITPGNYNVTVNGTGSTTLISRDATLAVTVDTLNTLWFIVTPDLLHQYYSTSMVTMQLDKTEQF